jgi:hypothetical protein
VQKKKPSEDGDKKKAKRPDLKAITRVSEDATSLTLFKKFYLLMSLLRVLLLIELLFMNNSSQVQFHLS